MTRVGRHQVLLPKDKEKAFYGIIVALQVKISFVSYDLRLALNNL